MKILPATILRVALLTAAAVAAILAQPPAPVQPGPAQPGPAAAKGKGAPRVQPPARIMDFRAEKTTLQPGESTQLIWAVENPTSTNITELGDVTARGNRRITPKATTTYRLTLRGPTGTETKDLKITVVGTTEVAAGTAAAAAAKPAPRLPNGKPDLTGVYNGASFSNMFGGRATREDRRDPPKLKPGAEKFKIVRGPTDAGQFAKCEPTGVPSAYFVPYQWEIVAHPDYIVILYEYPHLFRVIPIASAGKPADHPEDPDPTWMGNSVAKWEGDTLVVDAVGFNSKTELPGAFRHTEKLHVIERFTRVDSDNLEWEATVEDPDVFVEPWKISRGYPLRTDLQTVTEFICENNQDYSKLFEEKK